jgi:hypothetical protein
MEARIQTGALPAVGWSEIVESLIFKIVADDVEIDFVKSDRIGKQRAKS